MASKNSMSSIVATKVFIPHDEFIWVSGEIIAENDDGTVDVRIMDKELPSKGSNQIKISLAKYNLTSLPLQNLDLPEEGVDDMTTLSYLHEPSILDNLRRYYIMLLV